MEISSRSALVSENIIWNEHSGLICTIAVEMCRERALPADTPTLESIGFTSEADGVALHAVEGELYNTAGDSEEMPAAKASTKKTKTLREPPVKKKPDVLKEKMGSEGGQDDGDSGKTDKAAATNAAEKTKELGVSMEQAKGSPVALPGPEPDKSAPDAPELSTECRKSLPPAAS